MKTRVTISGLENQSGMEPSEDSLHMCSCPSGFSNLVWVAIGGDDDNLRELLVDLEELKDMLAKVVED